MSQLIEDSPLQAGREAAARHAWREALELLKQADASADLNADDLVMLGESAWWLGRLEDSISARERAYAAYLSEGNNRRAAVMAITLANDYFGKLAHSIGAGWFNKAERLLQDEPECAERGWISMMHAFSSLQIRDNEAALSAADETLEIGTRFGDRDLQAFGLLFKGKALVSLGQVDQGLALLDEATVAAVSGELRPFSTGMIYCVAISTTSELADYSRAGEWTEASNRWCERQSIAGFPGICRVHRAEIMRLRGSWAEAEQEARRALTELKSFNLMFAAEGFYELGEVRLRMGDLAGAEDAFRQAHELGRDPQPGMSLLRLAEGKVDVARSSIGRALGDSTIDRLQRMRLLPGQVEIALASGALDTARTAVEEMEEINLVYDSKVLLASTLCARGTLQLAEGDSAGAIKSIHKSWRLWKEADLPYEAARARLLLGLALRADGDEDAAEMELTAARSAFEKLGAVLDFRRAMELLGEEVAEGIPKSSVPVERVTKTFMFTDIVGSTDLAGAMGDEAWGNVLAWHDDTMRKLLMAHCGEEVKQVGDGFFAAFDDPNEAIECAADIQQHFASHRKEAGFAPQLRIGLHRAEATRKGRDYEGRGVHEAARIGALAEAGGILASLEVISAARVRFPISEARSVELKGISEPVEVAAIAAD
jgi:class 3 adenylate cyclase